MRAEARARDVLATPPAGFERSPVDASVIVATEPGARAAVSALGLERLDGAFAHPPLRAMPWKAIARVEAAGRTVYVKRYDFDRRVVFVKALLKWNFPVFSGPTELANVLALRAAGIPAPRPLAAGERDEGARRHSFVALEALPGRPLEDFAPPATPGARRALVRKVAELVRAFHAAGFWHKDLYLANVLFDEATGALGIVDCERVRWRAGGPPSRARERDLGSLDYSAEKWSRTSRLLFVKSYLGVSKLDDEGRAMARAVRRRAGAIGRRGRKA